TLPADEWCSVKLSFHGADCGVTGSCHLVECGGKRVLIDCGLYQGHQEIIDDNAQPFGFDPASVDYVLLSHAHLDHCGRLPLLVQQHFRGEVITTSASCELARLVLLDAGHLQEEEARARTRRMSRQTGRSDSSGPLYSVLDAMNSLDHFGRKAT